MPFWVHLILVVLITVFFIYRFCKEKRLYEFLFIIWGPSTLLQYVSNDPVFKWVLGLFQLVIFILVVFLMFKRRGKDRKRTMEILSSYASGDLDKAMGSNKSAEPDQPKSESESEGKE